ncbi:3-dehydroquinate synthase [Caldanaerobius fijiensis DSM 17918]|uniref:3-dehydroquinate synthase n=1 Tax=Caldanaerobius fijiensis DSM 17918 TaxID=1121256 RepID=A0A1M5EVH3_9THEO|nr:3-dehydroquinate synthase [Caldanaerobius fijiensis]SHF83214.1 3-dehydroquinate synthase [Caldanaerobius fijiensis DSM 17918]
MDLIVELGKRSYPIIFCDIDEAGQRLTECVKSKKFMVITDDNVEKYYLKDICRSLESQGYEVVTSVIPAGEESKTMETAKGLLQQALKYGLDRTSCIAALGGGVVGDISGFVAATYMRGIDFVQIPTTLLAQVDSSVGGKVAVNLPEAKNIVGAFHQPRAVIVDVKTLKTLPERELKTGLAEVIKYGVIRDKGFFQWLDIHMEDLLALDMEALKYAIKRSCEIKAEIVGQDETEQGLRAVLNFGHTLGHALEALTDYKKYTHGEAVAIGMVYASKIALNRKMISQQFYDEILKLIKKAGLPTVFDDFPFEEVLNKLTSDKKAYNGRIIFALVDENRNFIKAEIHPDEIKSVLY